MLKIFVSGSEWFDEEKQEFVLATKPTTLLLEHSLLSISKWEAKWKKPFLIDNGDRPMEEMLDYIRCMTINKEVDEAVYHALDLDSIRKIRKYMDDPMSATTITRHKKGPPSRKIVTSEVIYSWMVKEGIPFECEKWHISRLMKLIEVCSIENGPQEKMSQKEILKQNAAINAMRKGKKKH